MLFLFIICIRALTWIPSISVDSGQSHTIATIYSGHYFITDNRIYFQLKYAITTTATLTLSVLWNDLLTLPYVASSGDTTLAIGGSVPLLTTSESGFGGGGITLVNVTTVRITSKFASLGSSQVVFFVLGSYVVNIQNLISNITYPI